MYYFLVLHENMNTVGQLFYTNIYVCVTSNIDLWKLVWVKQRFMMCYGVFPLLLVIKPYLWIIMWCPEHIHVLDGIKQKYLRVNSVFFVMYEFNSMSCRILFFFNLVYVILDSFTFNHLWCLFMDKQLYNKVM